jgi:hypothetical protein
MSCCPQATAALTKRHRLRVRYGGGRPVLVRGPVTSVEHRFSGLERVQLMDPRDAVAIVRNPLFRIEGIVEVTGAEARPGEREEGHG